MLIKISVTTQDIRRGTRGSSVGCPIARALTRAGLRNVTVGGGWIHASWLRVALPPRVKDFVEAFDLGEIVKAFSFRLRVPKNALKLGGKSSKILLPWRGAQEVH